MYEITEKTLVPKEWADMVEREFEKLMDKGTPVREAVRQAVKTTVIKWKRRYANKSGS